MRGAVVYQPSCEDGFTFQVSDGIAPVTAVVHLTITPVADDPIARRDIVQIAPGAAATIAVLDNDEDPDGGEIGLVEVSGAAHGTAGIDGDAIAYSPAATFVGTEHLSYTIAGVADIETSAIVYLGVGVFPSGIPQLAIAPLADNSGGDTWQTDLSGDGRYVAFVSAAPLSPVDTNASSDVYVQDRLTGTNTLISVTATDAAAGHASLGGISDDGRYVAFRSSTQGITADDTSTAGDDLFVRDRVAATTVLAGVSSTGVQPTSFGVAAAALSGDGRHVAFLSRAYELVTEDTNGTFDLFVRDLDTGVTERASVSATGVELDLGVTLDGLAIDADGSVVAFASLATNVVGDVGGGVQGVFVRDRAAGSTIRASVATTGAPANDVSGRPSLSADGRIVAFLSKGTNLVPGATSHTFRPYVHDRATGITYLLPTASIPVYGVAISATGRYVAVQNSTYYGGNFVIDRVAGTFAPVSKSPVGADPDGGVGSPAISADGRYVAYASNASNLGVDPQPTGTDIFVAPDPL